MTYASCFGLAWSWMSVMQAFCLLFGLVYALRTFQFVQQVMVNLGRNQLAPKIQTLKNQLTR